jgi:hypothetical protein
VAFDDIGEPDATGADDVGNLRNTEVSGLDENGEPLPPMWKSQLGHLPFV